MNNVGDIIHTGCGGDWNYWVASDRAQARTCSKCQVCQSQRWVTVLGPAVIHSIRTALDELR